MSALETRGPTIRKVLTADMAAISSQTTLQNVTGLGVAIGASSTEIWRIYFQLVLNSAEVGTTMDAKFGFTFPSGATMLWGATGAVVAGWGGVLSSSTPAVLLDQTQTLAIGSPSNAFFGFAGYALVFGGGTAGTIQLQYAQNTSVASNLTVKKGSLVTARKLAA
jgi:hypothetical protein